MYFDQWIHVKCGRGGFGAGWHSELATTRGHALILCGIFYHPLKATVQSFVLVYVYLNEPATSQRANFLKYNDTLTKDVI